MQQILSEIAAKHKLHRKSGRWNGPCPKCGGSAKSDKFVIQDDGGFKCYGCDFKGDIISWLREMDGMSCPDAHAAAGKPCRSTTCPVYGTCRFGDGSGKRTAPARRPLTSLQPAATNRLPNTITKNPEELWVTWATALVEKSAAAIKEQPDVIRWLADRGIDALAIARFRLGWIPHDKKVKRKSIGLEPRNGKDHLWIPGGLLVTTLTAGGEIHRIRVRRPTASRERFLSHLKYVWIEGSGTAPLVIRPTDKNRGTVIIEAELDAYACAAAHPHVTVIALGTVSAGLPEDLRKELAASPIILVALDAEPGKDGKPGPGPAAIAAWKEEYRHARFWPVPTGKDPGEYAQQGGDLHAWIESGLVPELAKRVPAQDLSFSPDLRQQGGEGDNTTPHGEENIPVSRIVTLTDGRTFHVTESKELWEQLVADGETVFSENELLRLQAACAECDADGARTLANATLDLKAVFSGAYIKRGGKKIDHYGYQSP